MTLALIVDNSLSSGAIVDGSRVLDGLIDRANRVLDRANAGDPLWLVVADGSSSRFGCGLGTHRDRCWPYAVSASTYVASPKTADAWI